MIKAKEEVQVQTTKTSAELITEAKALPSAEANALLIQASKTYLQEENYAKALWLSTSLLPQQLLPKQQYALHTTAASAAYSLQEESLLVTHLAAAKQLAAEHKLEHSIYYHQLQYDIAIKNQQQVDIINAQLQLFAFNQQASSNDIEHIWQGISFLTDWQLNQLAQLNAPNIKGWIALAKIANKFGGSTQFKSKLNRWQQQYPIHAANAVVQNLKEAFATSNERPQANQNITVLLPLTGKQAAAGVSAQQGILAAYDSSQAVTLNFIDTETLDFTTLASQLTDFQTHYVIGPLKKAHVKKYLALTELTIPTLLLNVPDEQALLPHQIALSMRPEDEAKQAASLLSQKQFKHPIVMSHQDRLSERIAKSFSNNWQQLTGEDPPIIYFEQGKKMQEILKETLDVDQSQERINALTYRIRESIKMEKRSRRDIDMIYLIGNPRQTRLLKPYIDVNTSPFADIIPVFASSRSHSLNVDKSTANDLKGLTFTQMPWLLESQQQNKRLAAISQQLWPKRNDSLEQIFAMGFDSYTILKMLPKMQQHHFVRFYGQTGTLKLGADNILTRSLLWGTYQRNKVSEIAME